MTDRVMLIRLLNEIFDCNFNPNIVDILDTELLADHLLANGVTFVPDINVGNKWIPVTERFPHAEYGESESVLTYNEFGMIRVLYFDGSCWCYPTGEVYGKPYKVTHWMPLPEPPKEDANET